jgi:YhcH/YjgK/YiaL family protein
MRRIEMISYFNLEEAELVPNERLESALKFLREADKDSLVAGEKVLIDGENVFAEIQEYETKAEQDLPFEAHNIYADIHYVVSGGEMFGIAMRKGLVERDEYDSSRDVAFYNRPEKYVTVPLPSGTCILVTPNIGHMPKAQMGESGIVKKIVVKVRMIK